MMWHSYHLPFLMLNFCNPTWRLFRLSFANLHQINQRCLNLTLSHRFPHHLTDTFPFFKVSLKPKLFECLLQFFYIFLTPAAITTASLNQTHSLGLLLNLLLSLIFAHISCNLVPVLPKALYSFLQSLAISGFPIYLCETEDTYSAGLIFAWTYCLTQSFWSFFPIAPV